MPRAAISDSELGALLTAILDQGVERMLRGLWRQSTNMYLPSIPLGPTSSPTRNISGSFTVTRTLSCTFVTSHVTATQLPVATCNLSDPHDFQRHFSIGTAPWCESLRSSSRVTTGNMGSKSRTLNSGDDNCIFESRARIICAVRPRHLKIGRVSARFTTSHIHLDPPIQVKPIFGMTLSFYDFDENRRHNNSPSPTTVNSIHTYDVRPRKGYRRLALTSYASPF